VPSGDVVDPAEAVAARIDMGAQDRVDAFAQREIGGADDPGTHERLELTTLGLGCDTGDELGLAHRPKLLQTGSPVAVAALHEDGRDDVVAGASVGQ
jgi:hypothetical protein